MSVAELWIARALIVLSMLGVAWLRPIAAERFHRLKATSDVYPLPAPEQTVVASLGYRSALADLIFSNTLVSYGLHFEEKRRFEFVGEYIDTVNALDPTFRDPYRFADSLLVFQSEPARIEHLQKAREIGLRGLANRPSDTELWLQVGQYLAYLAPPFLPEELAKAYRHEGGQVLARACELATKDQGVPYGCITAAKLLETAGEREAAIESMRRLLAVNDDPGIERLALGYLRKKLSEREEELQARRKVAFREVWKPDFPFLSKDAMLVVGPKVDLGRCAGKAGSSDPDCYATWRDWARRVDPARRE